MSFLKNIKYNLIPQTSPIMWLSISITPILIIEIVKKINKDIIKNSTKITLHKKNKINNWLW